ncbi:MAG: sigma-70 family RNA polymerase sigma factor [Muribaculaceae bacterium]|nr:sigma-70 family RNA polymerase sigma factor [Muribaculaceae bacterium]
MKTQYLNIDLNTLVEECRSGDREAMSILYTRFAPRMLRVIYRYVPDPDSAQDILHDGFIAAFTHLDTLHDPDRIEFWLASIMKNLSLKFLQAQSVTSLLDEIGDMAASESDSSLFDILDFATLESLIRELPEGYQKVFRLAVLDGKSHKEISQILGIAPNSSSSQLFHAKLRLRQLIKDSQLLAGLISLLLLLISVGILFFPRPDSSLQTSGHLSADSTPKKQTSGYKGKTNDDTSEESTSPDNPKAAHASITSLGTIAFVVDKASESKGSEDQLPTGSADRAVFSSDSIEVSTPPAKPESKTSQPLDDDSYNSRDGLFAEMPRKGAAYKGWSAGIFVDPGMLCFNSLTTGDLNDLSNNNRPWDSEQPPSGSDDDKDEAPTPTRMLRGPQKMESYLATANRYHHLPVSFALTAEKRFSTWLGLESGIGYSYLHTDFEHYNHNDRRYDVSTCHWHYLEIPMKVNLYAYTSPRFNIYFGFGGRVAVPIYSYARIAPNPYCQSGRFDSKAVWSMGGSIGASFRLSKRIDLFVEPSLRYHFPQDCGIPNIWTDDEPWTLSIPLGIRFSW